MAQDVSEGGCLCGTVRYRVEGVPSSSSVCFCRSCRLASGASPVAWVVFDRSRFRWLQGQPSTIRSSPPVQRDFCGECGTPLAYRHDDEPEVIELNTMTLDAPERFPPRYEIWHQDRVPWAASDPRLLHYVTDREDGRTVEG